MSYVFAGKAKNFKIIYFMINKFLSMLDEGYFFDEKNILPKSNLT